MKTFYVLRLLSRGCCLFSISVSGNCITFYLIKNKINDFRFSLKLYVCILRTWRRMHTRIVIYFGVSICETYYGSTHKTSFIIHKYSTFDRYLLRRGITIFAVVVFLPYSHCALRTCVCVYISTLQAILNVSPLRAFNTCNHRFHACSLILVMYRADKTNMKEDCFDFSINIFFILHLFFFLDFFSVFTGWDIQHNKSVGIKFCAINWRRWQIDNMSCWKSKSYRTLFGNNMEIERCL